MVREQNNIIVIGGVENSYRSLATLIHAGENVVAFYTRDELTPGWEGIAPVNETDFPELESTRIVRVRGHINDYAAEIAEMEPHFVYSLGWTKMFNRDLLNSGRFIGVHQSLLPKGAGICPIANAILHDLEETGTTFFWVSPGVDSGGIIAQAKCSYSPQTATSTQIYKETMELETQLLEGLVIPLSRRDALPSIPQDKAIWREHRFPKGKTIDYNTFPKERVVRARTYPYA